MFDALIDYSLKSRGFVRIHRRYLVNRSRIDAVTGANGDRRVMVAGKALPVGSRFGATLPKS